MYVDRRPFDGHFQEGKREQSHGLEGEIELSRDEAQEPSLADTRQSYTLPEVGKVPRKATLGRSPFGP